MSRSYGQLCGLALALDVVGDRWNLLIIRELLVRPHGARYTDLRDGLPGIATNLLADRLRDLETSGVLRREEPRPPVSTQLFRLTELGEGLRPAVEALAVWGGEQVPAASGDDEFRSRWLIIPIEAMLRDTRTERAGDDHGGGHRRRTGDRRDRCRRGARPYRRPSCGPAPRSARLISWSPARPRPVLGVLSGKLPLPAAERFGVRLEGDRGVLTRTGLASDDHDVPPGAGGGHGGPLQSPNFRQGGP